jgi:Holliday junction resolvase RusA-like endonuclease
MKTSITFFGRVPSKKNNLRRVQVKGRLITLPSVKYCDWESTAVFDIKMQQINQLHPPYKISYRVFAPDRKASDLSNKIEGINDALVKAGVITDDNWFVLTDLSVSFIEVDKANPRIEVEIISAEVKAA